MPRVSKFARRVAGVPCAQVFRNVYGHRRRRRARCIESQNACHSRHATCTASRGLTYKSVLSEYNGNRHERSISRETVYEEGE